MGKPKAPTPPDPVATANAQGAANINSAIGSQVMNMTGQNSPYGSVSYDQTGSYQTPDGTTVPRFTQNVSLSRNQQNILDSTEGLQQDALDTGSRAIGNVDRTIRQPFSLSGLPQAPASISSGNTVKSFANPSQQMNLGINDFSADRRRVEDALMSRFNEDIAKREANEISQLNAQGIQRGSEGYGDAMSRIDRAKNDALTQAILGGGAEQQRMFDMKLGSGNFANQAAAQQFAQNQAAAAFENTATGQDFSQDLGAGQYAQSARQNALSERALERSQPINEFATLFGLGSQVNVPGGSPQTGVGINPADILGANALSYQVAQNNYNTQMANRASLGNLFGTLGAAGILASDARLKNVRRRIGQTDSGIPLYLFSYKRDPDKLHVGVLAQEAMKVIPDAVMEIGGMLHVNYGRL